MVPELALRKQLIRLHEGSSDDEVQEAFELVEWKHPDKALMLFEMLFELKRGDAEAASMRLKLFLGEAVDLSDEPELEQQAVENEINSDQLVVLNELSVAERERLLDSEFQEWMVYLHPDQKRVAEADFERPVVLTGVSGSGKTCILIHRARYLAQKYPNERIGILTLNRSLARLLRNLVDQLCVDGEAKRIEVYAFYDYFRELLHVLGPDRYLDPLSALIPAESQMQQVFRTVDRKNLANEVDIRSGETLEDTWNDFYQTQNPGLRGWLADVTRHLEEYRIDASRYPGRACFTSLALGRSTSPTCNSWLPRFASRMTCSRNFSPPRFSQTIQRRFSRPAGLPAPQTSRQAGRRSSCLVVMLSGFPSQLSGESVRFRESP